MHINLSVASVSRDNVEFFDKTGILPEASINQVQVMFFSELSSFVVKLHFFAPEGKLKRWGLRLRTCTYLSNLCGGGIFKNDCTPYRVL